MARKAFQAKKAAKARMAIRVFMAHLQRDVC
jgi:hypothetical protein